MSKVLGLKLTDDDWVRLESVAGSMGVTKWARMILMREVNLSGEKVNPEPQKVNHPVERVNPKGRKVNPGYDFSKLEVVKRGPGRKPGSCDHKPFKRKDGLVVCENCGVRL